MASNLLGSACDVLGIKDNRRAERCAHRLTMTGQRGRSLLAAPHQRVRAVEARMVAGLSEQERHDLVRLLGACAHALTPTGSADRARQPATHVLPGGPGTRQDPASPS